jgi:hypothetical protein
MDLLPWRYETPETQLNSYNIAVQNTIATVTSRNYSLHIFIINLVSLWFEMNSVLTNKSSFYGVDNPGRWLGRAEVNRYTTQTRQTNSQMTMKEEANNTEVWKMGSFTAVLMTIQVSWERITYRFEGACWLAPSSAVQDGDWDCLEPDSGVTTVLQTRYLLSKLYCVFPTTFVSSTHKRNAQLLTTVTNVPSWFSVMKQIITLSLILVLKLCALLWLAN